MISIQHNLDDLGRTFARYRALYSKGQQAALRKMAHNFGVYGARRLKEIAPAKGEIRSTNLARMKARQGGLLISDRAKTLVYRKYGVVQQVGSKRAFITGSGKRGLNQRQKNEVAAGLTLQNFLVRQELNLRESHSKFLASSMIFRGAKHGGLSWSVGKGATKLGQALELSRGENDVFAFDWNGSVSKASGQAATGLLKPEAQKRIAAALNDTRLDMLKYIRGEHKKAANAAARSIK